jgi:hypothetical protein
MWDQPPKRARVPPPTLKRSLPAQIFHPTPKRARFTAPAPAPALPAPAAPAAPAAPHPLFVELIQYVNRLEQRIAALEQGHRPTEPSFQPGIVVF